MRQYHGKRLSRRTYHKEKSYPEVPSDFIQMTQVARKPLCRGTKKAKNRMKSYMIAKKSITSKRWFDFNENSVARSKKVNAFQKRLANSRRQTWNCAFQFLKC